MDVQKKFTTKKIISTITEFFPQNNKIYNTFYESKRRTKNVSKATPPNHNNVV